MNTTDKMRESMINALHGELDEQNMREGSMAHLMSTVGGIIDLSKLADAALASLPRVTREDLSNAVYQAMRLKPIVSEWDIADALIAAGLVNLKPPTEKE